MSENNWYLIESETSARYPVWVRADSELGAFRIFAQWYGDDNKIEVKQYREGVDEFDYEAELDTPNPPFAALVENESGTQLRFTQKEVNQAGSKGLYSYFKEV